MLGSSNHEAFLQDSTQHLTPRIHDWGRGSTERGPDRGLALARRLHICRGRVVFAFESSRRMMELRGKSLPGWTTHSAGSVVHPNRRNGSAHVPAGTS